MSRCHTVCVRGFPTAVASRLFFRMKRVFFGIVRFCRRSFFFPTLDQILLAGNASSSGSHRLHIFIRSARVFLGNAWKHRAHFWDVKYSSTYTQLTRVFFLIAVTKRRGPGHRLCFLIGDVLLILAAPTKIIADLLANSLWHRLSIALCVHICLSKASRVYVRRVYVRTPASKKRKRWQMYSCQ